MQNVKITRIGIVNKEWRTLLELKLKERKSFSRCRLHIVDTTSNITFYQSIMKAHDLLARLRIDVVVGDSRLDVAQAAAQLQIPFFAFDSKLHVQSRPEYDKMPYFFTLPVSEDVYALAVFDILAVFRISQVAIIIDGSVDYKNFIQPFFERKSLFSKVWTIPDIYRGNSFALEAAVGSIMKEIRQRKYQDIVVKCNKLHLKILMTKARYYGMVAKPIRWYIPGFVCENFGLRSLKHIYSNFTFINEMCIERYLRDNQRHFEINLINQFIQITRTLSWNFTPSIVIKKLKRSNSNSLSFNKEGTRNRHIFVLHTLSRVASSTLSLIGTWQKIPGKSRKFHLQINPKEIESSNNLMPAFMRIVAVEEHPHLIVRANNTMEGFGVDLTMKLSQILGFNFSITVVGSYGEKVNGRWTGLIGELIYGKADLSLGPVVQTREREDILDFSTTFKQREISLVMRKPRSSPSYFQFLGPFSTVIWICVVSSIVILTMVLWTIEYFHDKHFPEPDRMRFDMKESSWFILASTLQGGTENVPFSIPGRILTATLYFFVIIIVTSYTANLAAFLTVKAYSNPITSVDDLASLPSDTNIKFGTVRSSAIHDFFKHSEIGTYQKIFRIMTHINLDWLVNNTLEGYMKALNENYVFIWDDSVNQYEIFTEPQYKCQLYIVGRPFGKRSFAIAMPQGSCYNEKINTAMLNLMESGKIENLEHKWWKSKSLCSNDASTEKSSGSLTVQELAGVFLVLVCGIVVSILALIFKIIILKCSPVQSIRNCCTQFFAHLPTDTAPPISPVTLKSTLKSSKQSTTDTKSDTLLNSPSEPDKPETSVLKFSFELDTLNPHIEEDN